MKRNTKWVGFQWICMHTYITYKYSYAIPTQYEVYSIRGEKQKQKYEYNDIEAEWQQINLNKLKWDGDKMRGNNRI